MHTWRTRENYIWESKCPVPIDYTEYQLLTPDEYVLDDQDEFLKGIHFADYFDAELYKQYGGDTPHEWRPQLIRNHLCALESQKRVTDMMLSHASEQPFDYVLYIRPDVWIDTEFKINYLDILQKGTIVIPDREHHEGLNDRFAAVCFDDCCYYGKRIDEIVAFRKTQGRIVSEKFVKFIIQKYFKNVVCIPIVFYITRPDCEPNIERT